MVFLPLFQGTGGTCPSWSLALPLPPLGGETHTARQRARQCTTRS
eukprot:SAG22_NODE_7441_length_739_cov_2.223438_1_plen_44_part_01